MGLGDGSDGLRVLTDSAGGALSLVNYIAIFIINLLKVNINFFILNSPKVSSFGRSNSSSSNIG